MALRNFFRLDANPLEFESPEELLDHFRTSNELRNVIYKPSELAPSGKDARFRNRTFINVSFQRTTVSGINFQSCRFQDCLFLGTRFVDCEFHRCTFDGCNPYQAHFERTYINPAAFEGTLDSRRHSNIGVKLFHALLENARATHQHEFANTAEFNFRLWTRYQLNYERRQRQLSRAAYLRRWVPNAFYHYLAGYGLRARYVAGWVVLAVLSISSANLWLWPWMGMIGREGPIVQASPCEALYFSIVTLSTLGYGDITPSSTLGMLMASIEAISGLVLLSLVASIVIRRALR